MVYDRAGTVNRGAAFFGGCCTLLKWCFLVVLPLVVFWFEIVAAPREDEVAFDKVLEKREGRREKRGKAK